MLRGENKSFMVLLGSSFGADFVNCLLCSRGSLAKRSLELAFGNPLGYFSAV